MKMCGVGPNTKVAFALGRDARARTRNGTRQSNCFFFTHQGPIFDMAALDGFLNDIDELAEGGDMYEENGGDYEERKVQDMTPTMQLEQELKLLHWHKLANEASLKAAIIRSKRVRGKDRDRGEMMT